MTKEQRIELMNILERLGAETYCSDCLFRNECASRADCIFDNMHDLMEKDGEQDTVEVVRCKDCHWGTINNECHREITCFATKCLMDFDDFCSMGYKRKDGEQ